MCVVSVTARACVRACMRVLFAVPCLALPCLALPCRLVRSEVSGADMYDAAILTCESGATIVVQARSFVAAQAGRQAGRRCTYLLNKTDVCAVCQFACVCGWLLATVGWLVDNVMDGWMDGWDGTVSVGWSVGRSGRGDHSRQEPVREQDH